MKLDDQLCFALYAATNTMTRAYRPLLGEIGLTYPQYLVMLVLWQHGPTTVGGIAEHLLLAQNAITPLVDRLERAGLVARRRDERDRRVVRVAPTDAGDDLRDAIARIQEQVECATLMERDRLMALRDELVELIGRMERSAAEREPAAAG